MKTKYADVFYGNGETDRFIKTGVASKWFYIKALCGNTTPHAVLPFGRMSVGPYSGGYPTGYGTHWPNSCGAIKKTGDIHKIRGFSHLHQSGTGGIRYYYNYAIVTPLYGDEASRTDEYPLLNEKGCPGYYAATFNDIGCAFTVNQTTAFHKYTFPKEGGRLAVDFSNDGLRKEFGERFYGTVTMDAFYAEKDDAVCFSGIFSGIKLYFAVQVKNAKASISPDSMCAVFDFEGLDAELKLSFSTLDFAHALENIRQSTKTFDETKKEAEQIWGKALSAIEIETDDSELKQKFYSNFYHSIVKPVDMTGESVLGISDKLVTDLATLWDQYKTVTPLVNLLYKDMGKKIADGIVNISRTLGKIPCSLGISDIFPCEEQAKMLGIFILLDAYAAGHIGLDAVEECNKRELERDDFKLFLEQGIFERYTHIIDTTDACFAVARLTRDKALKERLENLAKNWVKAYDADGLMSEKSPYYEGDRYTYSFRLQANMDERIDFVGGKENYAKMLDSFFGFGKESLEQITCFDAYEKLEAAKHHRFEGFNNECDMETPFSYIYAGRHDRLCEIVNAAVNDSFGLGINGLPGNNDSGGLSSCFMWLVLGIFPVAGQGKFLLGAPKVKQATLTLFNGNTLKIKAENLSKENYFVEKITFNGKEISDYTIPTEQLISGGEIIFTMCKKSIDK